MERRSLRWSVNSFKSVSFEWWIGHERVLINSLESLNSGKDFLLPSPQLLTPFQHSYSDWSTASSTSGRYTLLLKPRYREILFNLVANSRVLGDLSRFPFPVFFGTVINVNSHLPQITKLDAGATWLQTFQAIPFRWINYFLSILFLCSPHYSGTTVKHDFKLLNRWECTNIC